MGDWDFNLGIGAFGRMGGGVTLSGGDETTPSLNLELAPFFIGAAEMEPEKTTDSFDGSEVRLAVHASIEIAPMAVIAVRPRDDGGIVTTGGAAVAVRAPIPVTTSSGRTIHPVAPYVSVGFLSSAEPGGGLSPRLSVGADFPLFEHDLGSLGLNVNYTLVGGDEHSFNAGISGSFDILGRLRTSPIRL